MAILEINYIVNDDKLNLYIFKLWLEFRQLVFLFNIKII